MYEVRSGHPQEPENVTIHARVESRTQVYLWAKYSESANLPALSQFKDKDDFLENGMPLLLEWLRDRKMYLIESNL